MSTWRRMILDKWGIVGAIGLIVLVSIWAGRAMAMSSLLPLVLVGVGFWVVLCLYARDGALFLIGASVAGLYLFPFDPEVRDTMLVAAYGAMVIFAVIHFRFSHRSAQWDKRLAVVVLALGVYMWLARNWSQVEVGTWSIKYVFVSATSLIPYLWLLIAGPSLDSSRSRGALLAGIAVGAALCAVTFLTDLQPWTTDIAASGLRARTADAIGNLRNAEAVLWVIGFVVLLDWRAHKLTWLKRIGLVLFLGAIGYSFSRSAYLALAAVMIIRYRAYLSRRWYLGIFLAILLAMLAPDAIRERVLTTWTAENGFEPSSATRLTLWRAAFSAFGSAPVFGIGLENFTSYLARSGYSLSIQSFQADSVYAYAHNYFLSLFALTGIVGGSLGLGMFWMAYQRSRELVRVKDVYGFSLSLCLIALFVSSLFGETLFDPVLLSIALLIMSLLVGERASDVTTT